MVRSTIVLDVTALSSSTDFELLLRTAAGFSETVGFVLGPVRVAPQLHAALARPLAPFLRARYSSSDWPGTTATEAYECRRYSVDEPVIEALATVAKHLVDFDGRNGMPFDLHFLRADGTPVLVSLTGDARAWFELAADELARLTDPIVTRLGLRPPPEPALTHPNAVWSDRANCIVESAIGSSSSRLEQLACRDLGDGRVEVCCVPFNVPDLALGDRIDVEPRHGKLVRVEGKVSRSGRYVVEIVISPLTIELSRLTAALSKAGFRFESDERELVVVDAVDDDEIVAVEDAASSIAPTTAGLAIGIR